MSLMTNTAIDTNAAYYAAKAAVLGALAGTDRDHRMTAEQVLAITGELPLTMRAGKVEPMTVDDVAARGAEVAGDSYAGFYARRVRHNGRS